jgi:hypothetical protein
VTACSSRALAVRCSSAAAAGGRQPAVPSAPLLRLTAAAAGESLAIDITIEGASALTAPIVIDDSVAIDTPVAGVVDATSNAYVAGDLIEVVFTYVAGGSATPLADTVVGLAVKGA